jgi:hypothetical protein
MRSAVLATLLFLAFVHCAIALPNCDACRKLIVVDEAATPSDIKKAYHQKALENHPDKNPDDPTAQERFLRIQGCYEGLIKRKCSGASLHCPLFPICLKGSITHRLYRA